MEFDTENEPYQPLEKLCVLAPGLLGASVAMACRKNRTAKSITIWSRRASSRAKIVEQSWCDEVFDDPNQAAADADIVVICAPVDFVVPLYNEIRDYLRPGTIVTDVGSTKSLICRQASAAEGSSHHFVGSHPMAGSEKIGMEHGDKDLFVNRPCIVTPMGNAKDSTVRQVIRFWKSLGALTFVKTPEDHDEIVANISHLPHLLASSLCHFLNGRPSDWEPLTSSGLHDTTRIASGDPSLWKAIIETNSDEIKRALSDYQDELKHIQSALTNGNMLEVVSILEKGKKYRDRLS